MDRHDSRDRSAIALDHNLLAALGAAEQRVGVRTKSFGGD